MSNEPPKKNSILGKLFVDVELSPELAKRIAQHGPDAIKPVRAVSDAVTNVTPRVQQYAEVFRKISQLRVDGVISATDYEMLWNGLERERAADLAFLDEMKKHLPQSRK